MSQSLRMTSSMCVVFAAMALLALISVTSSASEQSDADAPHSMQKRSITQMCKMMSTYTGRSCWDYNNYGCFCGRGSRGNNPVDAVDRCCQEHDRCWDRAGCRVSQLLVPYDYSCSGRTCTCNEPSRNSCAFNTCQCDLRLSQCLGRTNYNTRFRKYNRALCR